MFLFKSVDKKIEELGFEKVKEDQHGVTYKRYDNKFGYTQCVDILHVCSGATILQSYYDKRSIDPANIGSTCVGLTSYEAKLFNKKMDKMIRIRKKTLKDEFIMRK